MGPVVCTQDGVCGDHRESVHCPWGFPTDGRLLRGSLGGGSLGC